MTDSEEESYCFFGKSLDPYDEDSFPKKRPIPIEDQVAKDEHGRRRFHGAFTGGFSAGFYNTVGSLEGWTPSEFKSSRTEKAQFSASKPEDYMDNEDIGEHGIAPQTVKATKDYSTSKKRKKQVFSDGPIPGEPVLHTLIDSGNDTIGYLLMRNMHYKRQNDNYKEENKIYGCEMPKLYEIQREVQDNVHIPEIYLSYIKCPKANTFGLNYVGLDRTALSVSKPSTLVVQDRNNKKLSVSGQAFGVGAFENDDEDIYVKDDMSQYDFEMAPEEKVKNVRIRDCIFDEFILCKKSFQQRGMSFPPPVLPQSFSGKHNVRKSRFEPVPEEKPTKKVMNADTRAKHLGEEVNTSQSKLEDVPQDIKLKRDIVATKSTVSETEHVRNESEINTGLIFGKFVSSTKKENVHNILEDVDACETLHGSSEMRDAAKLKMFGPLTRLIVEWHPCTLVCKRFNVPEPVFGNDLGKSNVRKKNHIIFEYQKNEPKMPELTPGLLNIKCNERENIEDKTRKSSNFVDINSSVSNMVKQNQSDCNTSVANTSNDDDKLSRIAETSDLTDRIDVGKNIDLFKAIFLSDSESENEPEEKDDKEREKVVEANVLGECLLPKIKNVKEGILSNIGEIKFGLSEKSEKNESSEEVNVNFIETTSEAVNSNLYGPKLPDFFHKVCNPVSKKTDQIEGVWIEKGELKQKSPHKHKKHKKEKQKKDKIKKVKHR